MISFASVNAVLFTPGLPNIVHFFNIGVDEAQHTISLFLIGYALGQLLYGPIANRFGRKSALYFGISLQIFSSFLAVFSGYIHQFEWLLVARFLLALGSSVGLKITFTLVNECYEPKVASQKISYLILAFAVTPGLSVALGGVLNAYYGWQSCFYASAVYGMILFFLVTRLPETLKTRDKDALKLTHLIHAYGVQFKNSQLLAGGLLMGCSACFVYLFAALAPFIAINLHGLSSVQYGFANILPSLGLVMGALVGAQIAKRFLLESIIRAGIIICTVGAVLIFICMYLNFPILYSLFLPIMIMYFGSCFITANASTIAMSLVTDKAHGSAVMNFLNVGCATFMVLNLGIFPPKALLLPSLYIALCIVMMIVFKWSLTLSKKHLSVCSEE
jgi:DHA1 family bicyclomycin/chloramphenicol resistance-like MFS transporter